MTSQWRFDKQQFILFINYHQIIFALKQSLAANWIHLPAGRRVSTHVAGNAAQRAELAADQLSRFHHQNHWPSNSPDMNPMNYLVWGAMLEAYRKLKTKPKTIAELKQALQVIWIDKSVKNFSKRLKACVGAGGGHFEHSQWQWNFGIWSLVNCVVSAMLLNWRWSQNIFECWKISRRSC